MMKKKKKMLTVCVTFQLVKLLWLFVTSQNGLNIFYTSLNKPGTSTLDRT